MKKNKVLNLINFSMILLLLGCNNSTSSISSSSSESQSKESSISSTEVVSSKSSISSEENSSSLVISSEEQSSSEIISSEEQSSSEISSSKESSSSEEISSSSESSSEEQYETFGDFKVIDGQDYVINENTISSTNGNFLLESMYESSSFHLRINLNMVTPTKDKEYGIILNGSYESNVLTGDLFKPYIDGNNWRLSYGTYQNGNYSEVFDTSCDFGTNFSGLFDLYYDNGTISWRMDDWCIGQTDVINKSGKTYITAKEETTITSLSIEDLSTGIGNVTFRVGWGGYNRHGYTYCFNQGKTHSFTMTLPDSVDKNAISKLQLSRFAINRMEGQKAKVKINDITMAEEWQNSKLANGHGNYYYELPLETIQSTNTLRFDIESLELEYCVSSYCLLYTINDKVYVADSFIIHSQIDEDKHNFSSSGIDWNDSQYCFVDLMNGNETILGNEPLKEVKTMKNPASLNSKDINITFMDNNDITVDFFDYVTLPSAFRAQTNELWLEPTGSTSMLVGEHTYTFKNATTSGKYYLDYYMYGFDNSQGGNENVYKITGIANYATIANN